MSEKREGLIVSASTNLLGICLVIVTGLKLTGVSGGTLADEMCLVAAIGFMAACICGYLSLRTSRDTRVLEIVADVSFVLSMLLLFGAVVIVASTVF